MSDPLIRKACDRCHHQKLSCKRTTATEESCERCSKLKVECRWSPSLRVRKSLHQQQQQSQKNTRQKQKHKQQQQQLHQSQHSQPQQPLQLPPVPHHGATGSQTIVQAERRSPKRRRTGSDPDLVSPDAGKQAFFCLSLSLPSQAFCIYLSVYLLCLKQAPSTHLGASLPSPLPPYSTWRLCLEPLFDLDVSI